jgi:hypothetical protein
MFTAKEREKSQRDLNSTLKRRNSHAGSMQPTGQTLDSLQVLQRNLGNSYLQAISEMGTQRHGDRQRLQAKLVVGSPDDVYEQEADRVAEKVIRMPEPKALWDRTAVNQEQLADVQRQCPVCEEELHRQPINQQENEEPEIAPRSSGTFPEYQDKEETLLQRKAEGKDTATEAPQIVQEVLRSPGQPLDHDTRAFMESRFRYDFSQVRVHTDAPAAESAQAVNALAYTVGRDVVFGARQFAPHTTEGRSLLAHELTHVVQQSGSLWLKLMNSEPGNKCEEKANRHAVCSMLQLQRTIQDQTVQQLLKPNTEEPQAGAVTSAAACFAHDFSRIPVHRIVPVEIQAKLTVNTPRDIYEQEADRVSDQVMHMTAQQGTASYLSYTPKEPPSIQITKAAPAIQRRTFGIITGSCLFENCQNQLGNFFMIPEDEGRPGFYPRDLGSSFTVPDVDGFWFRFRTPRNEWFKISDGGIGHVRCTPNEYTPNFNVGAPFVPGWKTDSIHTSNPYGRRY